MVCDLFKVAVSFSTMPCNASKLSSVIISLFLLNTQFIVWKYYTLFSHNPIDGKAGCFRVRTITNTPSMNNSVPLPCGHKFSFLWDKHPGL